MIIWSIMSCVVLILSFYCVHDSGKQVVVGTEYTDLAMLIACCIFWPVGLLITSIYLVTHKVLPWYKEFMK